MTNPVFRCINSAALIKVAGGGAMLAALAACTTMAELPPGTPVSQVQAQYGAPDQVCPLPNGGQRMIWSSGPMGQYAWGTNVDSSGKTDQVVPVLTDEHFQVLKNGTWTPDQVLCEFGPPAETSAVGLPSSRQVVWSYRYKQNGVWNSLMHVYMGRDGTQVTHFHPGPDPMFEVRDGRVFSF